MTVLQDQVGLPAAPQHHRGRLGSPRALRSTLLLLKTAGKRRKDVPTLAHGEGAVNICGMNKFPRGSQLPRAGYAERRSCDRGG